MKNNKGWRIEEDNGVSRVYDPNNMARKVTDIDGNVYRFNKEGELCYIKLEGLCEPFKPLGYPLDAWVCLWLAVIILLFFIPLALI